MSEHVVSPVLVWFRHDLRLHDHEVLTAALGSGAPVVPVYCLDPRSFRVHDELGVPRWGVFRLRFLIQSLADLRAACRAIGGDLVVRVGEPETILPELARSLGARALYHVAELVGEAHEVEIAVHAALDAVAVRWHAMPGQTLVHRDDLPFDVRDVPDVFTQFRRRVEREVAFRDPLPSPTRLPPVPIDPGAMPSLTDLGFTAPHDDPRVEFSFVGGELAALSRLHDWVWEQDRLRSYKATRNGMLDPNDASRFSAWLALGCLSPRTVYAQVRRYERERVRNEDTHWLVVELLWRDYFRLVAEASGARLFSAGGPQGLRFPWRTWRDPDVRHDFDAWARGMTGVPLVDAGMRELAATGFTSNRARQNVASFLTRVLGIDWRLGAQWFAAHLIDDDVASNWGNWAYVAGVGQDARGFRFFNPYKQAQMYDPNAEYLRFWLPELGSFAPELAQQPGAAAEPAGYPAPMVDVFAAARTQETQYLRATVCRPARGQ